MKKLIFYLVLLGTAIPNEKITAQAISNMFFGQNYWIPSKGGYFGGSLENYWQQIKDSGVKWMRIGGTAYDAPNNYSGTSHIWTAAELANGPGNIISTLRSYGIEPIVQVPIDITHTVAWNAATCSTLVHDVNVTYGGNVTYWEIGNEPNIQYTGTNNYNTDATIASYIIAVSDAMKGVSGQSGIKIIGPSFAGYNTTSYSAFLGGSANISGSGTYGYYIDYISYNTYPLLGQTNLQSKTRADVISNLTASVSGHFKYDLADLITKIGASGRTTSNLKIAITEANISYEQDVTSSTTKGATGIGPGSFLGGQFWAEMMAVAMEKSVEFISFWSVIEGAVSYTITYPWLTDIGYISSEYSKMRPTYWHYNLMANNFKGTYLPNLYGLNGADYKAFAYKNTTANEIGVLVMNQDAQSPRDGSDYSTKSFKINFNNTSPSGTYDMKFYFNGSASAVGEYACTIMKETSMLLVFDLTTGKLKKRETYSLQDALRSTDTGTQTIINNATEYSAYSNTHSSSDITIGTGTSISATASKDFKAKNSILLNGIYSSNGNTLTLEIDSSCP